MAHASATRVIALFRGPALACTALVAVLRMHRGFSLLLFGDRTDGGAVDLYVFHALVHDWFARRPVYGRIGSALYPPASYPLLWPFVGWLDISSARWLWAVTVVLVLGTLVWLLIRETCAATPLERAAVGFVVVAIYPTAVAIANGQLVVHIVLALLAAVFLLRRRTAHEAGSSPPLEDWRTDAAAAGLFLVSLAKPSISAPFFWLLLILPRRLRPAALVVAGYLALTLFAAAFQTAGMVPLTTEWLRLGAGEAAQHGSTNVHLLLGRLGARAWLLPTSLFFFTSLGAWIRRHRDADLWLLLGVTAIIARLWTYHLVYDDFLILLPMVALWRSARTRSLMIGRPGTAAVLLVVTAAMMLAPGRVLSAPPPWGWLSQVAQALVWCAMLTFLLITAAPPEPYAATVSSTHSAIR